MGYPRYAIPVKCLCMRMTKVKPMTVIKHGDPKTIKILVSELNPPICAAIRELAQGGVKGSVPVNFASRMALARTCPPPPCPCKPCVVLTPRQKLIKNLILAAKIIFLGGSIFGMWYIGVFGPTWDTWNLTECVRLMIYACLGIEFQYKDKCKAEPELDKGPLCISTETTWNKAVITFFIGLTTLYRALAEKFQNLLNYENCEYVKEEKKQKPSKTDKDDVKEKAEKKPDNRKIWASIFSEMDPQCGETPDYYAMLSEMMRENDSNNNSN